MGDIGPNRAQYEVLPVPEVGLADADRWTVEPPVSESSVERFEAVSRDDADR